MIAVLLFVSFSLTPALVMNVMKATLPINFTKIKTSECQTLTEDEIRAGITLTGSIGTPATIEMGPCSIDKEDNICKPPIELTYVFTCFGWQYTLGNNHWCVEYSGRANSETGIACPQFSPHVGGGGVPQTLVNDATDASNNREAFGVRMHSEIDLSCGCSGSGIRDIFTNNVHCHWWYSPYHRCQFLQDFATISADYEEGQAAEQLSKIVQSKIYLMSCDDLTYSEYGQQKYTASGGCQDMHY